MDSALCYIGFGGWDAGDAGGRRPRPPVHMEIYFLGGSADAETPES